MEFGGESFKDAVAEGVSCELVCTARIVHQVEFPAHTPLSRQRLRFIFGTLSIVGKIHGTHPSGAKTPTVGEISLPN